MTGPAADPRPYIIAGAGVGWSIDFRPFNSLNTFMGEPLFNTPSGCRIDNGRCFDRLEWLEAEQAVYAYFHDGSEYLYRGLSREQAMDWFDRLDPGCYFNQEIWPGQYFRIKGPD